MNSRNSIPIRAAGQRSIPSTLLFRPSPKSSSTKNEDSNGYSETKKNESNMSLTSFLNRKSHTTSVLPIHKDKINKLHIPQKHNGPNESNDTEQLHLFGRTDGRKSRVIDESVFKLFNSSEEKVRKRSSECLSGPSRLQRVVKKDTQKHLLVLGDDPKPKRRAYRQVSNGEEKPPQIYNHYENGTGWWNSEREGVDNDEVGQKEVWEGVGSTTLGGLNWH